MITGFLGSDAMDSNTITKFRIVSFKSLSSFLINSTNFAKLSDTSPVGVSNQELVKRAPETSLRIFCSNSGFLDKFRKLFRDLIWSQSAIEISSGPSRRAMRPLMKMTGGGFWSRFDWSTSSFRNLCNEKKDRKVLTQLHPSESSKIKWGLLSVPTAASVLQKSAKAGWSYRLATV